MSKFTDKFLNSVFKKINSKAPKRSIFPLALIIFLIYPLNLFLSHYPSTNLSDVWVGDNLGKDILLDLPKNSILVIYDDAGVYNTKYIQMATKTRNDVFIPTSSSDFFSYAKRNKSLTKAADSVRQRYSGIEKNDRLYLILTLKQMEDVSVFYLRTPSFEEKSLDKEKLKEINFTPYGLLLKMAKNDEILTKDQFIKQQNEMFEKMQLKKLITNKDFIRTNYNLIHISSLYSAAYLNTSSHLQSKYKDLGDAIRYSSMAAEINPLAN